MINLKIKDKNIRVVQIAIFETYQNLLCGDTSDSRVNKVVLESLIKSFKSKLDGRATLVLEPVSLTRTLSTNAVHVWLRSEPKDEDANGSELVVFFLAKINPSKSLMEILEENIKDIDFGAHCQDIYY